MPATTRINSGRRTRRSLNAHAVLAAALLLFASVLAFPTRAHEGHDHDKPAPLNLPIAPRVTAVTPDYELVGVRSGAKRLTIFLRRFETSEPIADATLAVSLGDARSDAKSNGEGIYELEADWLQSKAALDLVFHLTLPTDQDVLAGTLEGEAQEANQLSFAGPWRAAVWLGLTAAALGCGLVGFAVLRIRRRRVLAAGFKSPSISVIGSKGARDRAALIVVAAGLLGLHHTPVRAQSPTLPSVPATMATDVPQRMPDGSLFVPAATQHLLAVRTALTRAGKASKTVQLVGTVMPDPNSFGRVQAGHAGRVLGPASGLPHVGKRVAQGEMLAFLQHHLEAYNKGNLQAEIAELEARIALQEKKLERYLGAPLAIPPIRIDETRGEIEALKKRRRELTPTIAEKEEIRAPISGIVSVVNAVAGQSVDSRDILFEIVDPTRFWIEAIAHDPAVATKLRSAVAVTRTGQQLNLEFAGLGLSLKQQASPLSFRIKENRAALSIGQPVTVLLQSSEEVDGFVLPSASVVRLSSGLSAVWVKTEPERFEPHTVRYEPLDGNNVVVLSGLKADMRVVTSGSTLINQIR